MTPPRIITSQRRFLGAHQLAAEPFAGDFLMMRADVPGVPPRRSAL